MLSDLIGLGSHPTLVWKKGITLKKLMDYLIVRGE